MLRSRPASSAHHGHAFSASFRFVHVGVAALVAAGIVTALGVLRTANAAGDAASVFVPIVPCRLMDTRPAGPQVGPRGTPIDGGETYSAPVWGAHGHCTIPSTATAVSLNVTFVNPSQSGFVTVYPPDRPWPGTSNLNFVAGQQPAPNAVTSTLSSDGRIGFFNNAGRVDLIADIVGFYQPPTAASAGPAGPAGAPGPKGDMGDPGPRPARVLWVAASGGDFTSVAAALASISDNDAAHPYLIRIAPGTFTEAGGLDLKDHVDIEGSGEDSTTITCACGSPTFPSTDGTSATVRADGTSGLHSELRDVAIANTGHGANVTAIWTFGVTSAQFSMRNVAATASGGTSNYGVYSASSAPTMTNVMATASGGLIAFGVSNNASSSPTMNNVVARASGATDTSGVFNSSSSATMTNVVAEASGGTSNYGIDNYLSSSTMTNVTATGTGGTESDGVYISGGPVVIRGSSIAGDTSSIFRYSGSVLVFDTELHGATHQMASALGIGCSNTFTTALIPFPCT